MRLSRPSMLGSLLLLFAIHCGDAEDTGAGVSVPGTPNGADAGQEPVVDARPGIPVVDADLPTGDPVRVERHLDAQSATYYFLTRIRHMDKGKLLELHHAQSILANRESIPDFAKRIGNPRVAFNASMGQADLPADGVRKPVGIQIVDGKIIQEVSRPNRFTLGIRDDNELVAYPSGKTA